MNRERLPQTRDWRSLVVDVEEQVAVLRIVELRQVAASYRGIVAVLNAEERPTRRGGARLPSTVRNVVERARGR